jgi:signal transduction histidine kinase
MAVQKYDIRLAGSADFEERYWSPVNSPDYIIHRVEDVTDFVRLKQQGAAHVASHELRTPLTALALQLERLIRIAAG